MSGLLFEAVSAAAHRRSRCDLYHSALELTVDGARFTIEMTPVPDALGATRGVVVEGPVGAGWAGRLRVFRYEIRCWPEGTIPDIAYAVASPIRVSEDGGHARRLLELVPDVPPLVWGRDPCQAGDMWNSNSVVAWLLAGSGVEMGRIPLPPAGRAPGWQAGLVARHRAAGPQAHPGRV